MPATLAAYEFNHASCLQVFAGPQEGALRYAEVFYGLFVLPGKDRLLEATEEASQVNIEEHRRMAYLPRLTKLKEVVFEELVAFHRRIP